MKLTEKHVPEKMLDILIEFAEKDIKDGIKSATNLFRLDALLELKQRRAEDRAKEAHHANG